MKFFLSLFLGLLSYAAAAQQFEITGKIVDQEEGFPLESATIFVERIADSSLVAYTISDKEGNFSIEGSENVDSLRLAGSYAGYMPLNRVISLDRRIIDLGPVEMQVATNLLGEVTVVSNRAPVTVKSDTLEFNAASFNTRQNANLEDVMKKLPGVEVDSQGNITVNGKPVSRILVNGKEFFGDDPKIATKNLPKEIIDKIQVVDTKTKTEEFTGKAGNPDDKTINITIQEDKNRGYFARATAGGGTDERYELSGIGNYFQDELRVSALASSNNINSSGFSFDEVYDMMGRGGVNRMSFNGNGGFSINGQSFGTGGGITKSETAGLNFTNEWDEKFEVNANYFFGKNDTETSSIVERETFLPDRNFFTNSVSEGNVVNDSHRANLRFEFEPDTLTRISVRPAIQINDGFSVRSQVSESLENGNLINNSATQDNEDIYSSNFSNRIDIIRRFGGRGAYLQLDFENTNNLQENENRFFSERMTYENGILESTDIRNQFIEEENQTDEYSLGLTQRSVLADKLFLDLSYEFNTENSNNERAVYDFDESTGEYSNFNQDLSNAFEVKSIKHIPNAGLNYEGSKWRTSLNVGLLNTSLKTENFIAETSLDKNYNNLYVSSNVRYEIKRGSSLYLYYRNDTDIPSVRQLQPVEDITNPTNIIIGNPDLDPAFSHRFNLGYHNFDFATRSGISTYASVSFTEDDVVPYTITGEDLLSVTTYTNVDGGVDANLGASYSKRYKKQEREFSYRLGANVNYSRQVGFSNTRKFNADRYGFRPSIRLGYTLNEIIELNPRYELNYVLTNYDINMNREEEYTNHTIGVEATSYWPENVVFGNDFSYNYFGNVAPGFDPTAILWNMSLGYQFLDEDATLKLKVYDLLNENVSTSRTTGDNYVQDTQELILEQYFMLSFTLKLSKFGGKDPNRRRGGVIRM
ncbi:outer membrane beta-barrel protein [Salinimicrobium sp. GXAS 041]|uniref:outer membrane beta-barrel protein n=1 Tax=Salinimicrobium sp. GXAS 041 TaxID=3400806 RepID=UPI003C749772